MPKYIIEQELPGAGSLAAGELTEIARKSCTVIADLGPHIQWVETYVTDDRLYCAYVAINEEIIREHARRGGFTAARISAVRAVIDPTTAEKVDCSPRQRSSLPEAVYAEIKLRSGGLT
jgi:hypothetical protein